MSSLVQDAMTPVERRAGISLAAIFALRMFGLFLILPVFSVHAHLIEGGNNLVLVGLALGAYGLTQACLQIAYGVASDRFGRKPVIVFGLMVFALGCVIAAQADSIYGIIVGRVLQGAGAVSAAVTALAADLTREQHRTKVMAMIGSSIGLVFAGSLVIAPLLYAKIGMGGLFWLTAVCALAAIGAVIWIVPQAPVVPRVSGARFRDVVFDGQLMRLNFGVFALHLIQTTMWVMVPMALVRVGGLAVSEHWKVYLPAVLLSFVVMVPAIIIAERHYRMKLVFCSAILLLSLVQFGLYSLSQSLGMLVFWLILFFIAFNILEATQPSLISRIAPPHAKGAALGVYNTLQSMGLFLGGILGGWLGQHYGHGAVALVCGGLALVWLGLATTMRSPLVRVISAPEEEMH